MNSELYGYNGKILNVDLAAGTCAPETRDEKYWRIYGGGGLVATALLLERTPPHIDPLSPENLLVFASSVVAGQPGPGLARFTVAAKSPLTGGIGETRAEGPWGIALKSSGFDVLAITGRCESPCILVIEDGSPRIVAVPELWGMGVGETIDELERKFGDDIHVAAIGPAGEHSVRYASVVAERGNQAARMGMGAVMGAKNLKAVVLRGGTLPPVYDRAALDSLGEYFTQAIDKNDLSRWQYEAPGFSCWIYLHGLDAALGVNNYSKSQIDNIDGLKEERFLEHSIEALPCPGCSNDCIKSISPFGQSGAAAGCGIHQEIAGAMGPNLGITNLGDILGFNALCNDYGLDPTSLGYTLSCYMELQERGIVVPSDDDAPRVSFGDAAGVRRLIELISRRQGIGDRLAEGSLRFAQSVDSSETSPETSHETSVPHGESSGGSSESSGASSVASSVPYAMQVKGLEMVSFEPRSQTNLALGYAVAPIGPRYDICEHDWDFDTEVGWEHTLRFSRTIGILERRPMNEESIEKIAVFKALNNLWSAADALDFCIFAIAPTRILGLEQMATILRAVTGWETSSYEIMRFGERRNHLMRLYNYREGFGPEHDTLPDRFFTEEISEGPRRGDKLNRQLFVKGLQSYYRMMGWDERGKPYPETLVDALIAP